MDFEHAAYNFITQRLVQQSLIGNAKDLRIAATFPNQAILAATCKSRDFSS